MEEKKTEELENVLKSTHASEFQDFLKSNKDSMSIGEDEFGVYFKELLKAKNITQQLVFLQADIPERYGYKLLSGEKKTRQRDVILRLCYVAQLTLDETQSALKKYGLSPLYAKIPRDALLMIIFNERPGDIIDVNTLLKENGFDMLRSSGVQD